MLILTWFIFILNPFFGSTFAIIGLYKERKNHISYNAMLALTLASLAYWFIPISSIDLTRYLEQLVIYNKLSWSDFVVTRLTGNMFFVKELFFYIVSKTGNFHLLPAIVVFIVYFIQFYMISDYANRKKISSKKMMIVLVFTVCVLPLTSIISNVRNVLAFSIFVFAVYRDLEQRKKNMITYILYILPLFIHISVLALIFIRLLLPLYNSTKVKRVVFSVIIGASTYLIGVITNLMQYLPFSNKLIRNFFIKANNYINASDSEYITYLQNSIFLKLQKIYFISITIFLLFVLILVTIELEKIKKILNKKDLYNEKILIFYSMICFVVIGTLPIILPVYMRFMYPVIMLSFIVLFQKQVFIKNKLQLQIISIGMVIGGISGLIHQIAFMSRMNNITQMITSMMVRSLLNMFIQ